MRRRIVLVVWTVLLATTAIAEQRLAVFLAAGPGAPPTEQLERIDRAVRRALILALPPDDFVTLMADAAAPGCTGRCAVARAAEYGASYGLAVKVDLTVQPVELRLSVYAAPDGRVAARRIARASSLPLLVELAARTAEEIAAALVGEAPVKSDTAITDPQAEQREVERRSAVFATAAGVNSLGMDMILVEPGRPYLEPPSGQSYVQARPLPEPPDGYLLAATEVTQAQWTALMPENPSEFKHEDRPVERVTWLDVVRYCNALSEHEGLIPAYDIGEGAAELIDGADGYRLPTDSEWEYACRAGAVTMFASGGRSNDLARTGWYLENSGGQSRQVADREPNAWGFFDMHGNVWEWIWDLYSTLPDLSSDNTESPGIGPDRTIRGGSWYQPAMACRTTNFCRLDPGFRGSDLGFRVARSPRVNPGVAAATPGR